jgi:acyl transferase domain-containing protein/acyl carrier protein
LTEHHLVIDEIIDVSPQIANFVDDPTVKENVKDLPKVVQDMYISYANQAVSLTNGWISYCLLKLKKDTQRSALERWNENAQKIAQKTPYPQALAEMVRRGHIPYPQSLRDPQKCNHNETFRDLKAIKDDLAEIFLTVLKLEPPELEAAETFQDLGISSINVVQLTEAVNSTYNLNLPTSILFECSNIDALADHINEYLPIDADACKEHPYSGVPGGGSPLAGCKGTPLEFSLSSLLPPEAVGEKKKDNDAIAIIGLSLRCAQAETQDEFWELVSQGKSGIEDITQKDWLDFFQFHSPTEFPYRYGRMRNVEYFNPSFFHISPREAKTMDVSQRILLEECYKALEDANYTPSVLSGKQVATVIGSAAIHPGKTDFSHFSMLGSHMSILASRIAYFLNLKGPALAIDTACSSSLVAIDIACQHLKSHEANLAIAGGITIYAHPGAFLSMRDAGMLSPTGECRPFDQAADGIVVGDGVGIVILKRLQDAERDGDYIYGVIQASGTNQDGQTSGITVPSFQSQSQLQQTIYQRHHINVEDLQYIEAHGTATKLGDPIEIHALTDAFKKFTAKKGFCAIGSLKANIGHTTAAAGVLGVIKVLLSLKHKQIPPSINFSRENEHIDFANSPVYVNTTLKPWPANAKGSRLAGISSFGFSGTNAHVVISEYVAQDQRTGTVARVPRATGLPRPYVQINEATPGVLILSAQTQEGLQVSARAIAAFLQKHNDINLADLLYTLQVGRESWSYRLALVVTSKEMLITQLEQFVIGENTEYLKRCARKINKQESLIGDSEEGKEVIQKLVQHKKLEKLADLWLHGNEISWEECYPQGSVKRLAGLPNYPFARDHYEISEIDLVPSHTNSYSKGEFLSVGAYPCSRPSPPTHNEKPAPASSLTFPKEKDKALKSAFAWDRVTLLPQASVASATHQVVIIGGTPEERSAIAHIYPYAHTLEIPTNASIERLVQRLQEFGAIEQLFWLESCNSQLALTQESILTAQQEGVLTCFRMIKALLQLGYGSQTLHWTVITRQTRILHANETCHPAHASLLGLFGSLAKEYPCWSIQQVDLSADVSLPLTEMLRLPADPQGHGWLYRHGHWYRQILVPLDISSVKTSGAYRKGGVYVVIGGAGGIGEVWSEYLIRRYQAQMIWIGRHKIDAAILTKQERLADLGSSPHYITADATDRRALQRAYEEIKRNYGQIHGVVHSAIVLLDQSLANMDEERFQSALAAKVDVSVCLAQVFEQEPLDFVLFFSSLNAFVRNAGQSNYAAGCTFEDAFAARLGQDWKCQVKVMNWGYWGSVGVVAQPVYRERMAQVGVGSIEPEEAMEALEYLLAGPVKQMALLKTTKLSISHDSILVSVPSRGSRKDTDSRYLPAGKAYTPNPSSSSANVPGEEMMQTGEMMMVYPEHTPSFLHRLYNYRPPLLKTESVRETQ